MFLYPYLHGPLAEVTRPGFACFHHQLPATIYQHTQGNLPVTDSFDTPVYLTLPPLTAPSEQSCFRTNVLVFRLPDPYHCISEVPPSLCLR